MAIAVAILYESTRNSGDPTLPDIPTTEAYVGHFLAYVALTFSAQMTFNRRSLWLASAIIGLAALFGALLEVYQSTLSGREASVFDALANLLGAITGVAFATFFWPRFEAWIRQA